MQTTNSEKPVTWRTYGQHRTVISIPYDDNEKIAVSVRLTSRDAKLVEVIDGRYRYSSEDVQESEEKVTKVAQSCISSSHIGHIAINKTPEHLKNIAIRSRKGAKSTLINCVTPLAFVACICISYSIFAVIRQKSEIVAFVTFVLLSIVSIVMTFIVDKYRIVIVTNCKLTKPSVNLMHTLLSSEDIMSSVCENMVQTVREYITERSNSSETMDMLAELQHIIGECKNQCLFEITGNAVHLSTRFGILDIMPDTLECYMLGSIITNILNKNDKGLFNDEKREEDALTKLIKIVKEHGEHDAQIDGVYRELHIMFKDHFANLNEFLSMAYLSKQDRALVKECMLQAKTQQQECFSHLIIDPGYEEHDSAPLIVI